MKNIIEINKEQIMASWSAFYSLVTNEDVTWKIVGYIPILPYPVTEYAVVYIALQIFQDIK